MAYLGIGYLGSNCFLRDFAQKHMAWLKGDRVPRFYGDNFVVLYDSNTAREFAHKLQTAAPPDTVLVYPMSRPVEE